MRAELKGGLRRGHVEIRLSLHRDDDAKPNSFNRELLGHYLVAFRQACEEFGLDSKPDLNALMRMPGVLDAPAEPALLDARFETDIAGVTAECVGVLNAFREREGKQLREALLAEATGVAEKTEQMTAQRKDALSGFHQRLQTRLAELLGNVAVDPNRLIQEAALLADRSDVAEELTRLSLHTQELFRLLSEGGEIGKRLDFLLQEMNRETNTVLSKTSGSGDAELAVTNLALSTKASIEKIREQALNLE